MLATSVEASDILGDDLHDDRGVGRGGKLSEIRLICSEFTIKFPISYMILLVDFLPLFSSSF